MAAWINMSFGMEVTSSLVRSETVLNTDGVITAICVTLMYTANYRSRRQITLLRKARSTRHNAVKHDGQLVTRFYGVTLTV